MGSGVSGRRLAGPFRGILLFLLDLLALGPVARTGLPAVADALGVEGAADDLVADAGQVLHPAAADEHGDRWQSPLLADCSCCSFNSTVSGVYSVLGPPGSQCSIGRGQGLQSG